MGIILTKILRTQTNNISAEPSNNNCFIVEDKSKNKSDIKDCNQEKDDDGNEITKKYIDKFVEEWYNSNLDIDIGNFNILGKEIDLLPDSIEKKIYKKTLLIAFSLLKKMSKETSLRLMDHDIKISIKPRSNQVEDD